MNNIFMKKASILAIIAVTALCMSACGDTSKNDESKKSDTSSVAAAKEESSTVEEENEVKESAAEEESKAEDAPEAKEAAEKVTVDFNNNVGVAVTKIQIMDSEGNVLDDLSLDNGMLTTGSTKSFEITSGDDLTVRYGTEDTTIFDMKGVKTSDLTEIMLCRNVNEPSVICKTKDGETRTIVGSYVEGFEYTEFINEDTETNYDEPAYEEPVNEEPSYEQPAPEEPVNEEPAQDNTDQGGCIGDDAFTF